MCNVAAEMGSGCGIDFAVAPVLGAPYVYWTGFAMSWFDRMLLVQRRGERVGWIGWEKRGGRV